jgi:hypothetical protein
MDGKCKISRIFSLKNTSNVTFDLAWPSLLCNAVQGHSVQCGRVYPPIGRQPQFTEQELFAMIFATHLLPPIWQCCTILCCAVQCSAVQLTPSRSGLYPPFAKNICTICHEVLTSSILFNAEQYCTIMCDAVQYYLVQCCTVLCTHLSLIGIKDNAKL